MAPTIAQNSLLKLSDFPQGWAEEPDPRPKDTKCEAAKTAFDAAAGSADSGRLHRPDLPVRDGSVYVYDDEAAAEQAFEALGDTGDARPASVRRFADAIAEQLGIEIGDIKAEPLSIGDYAATRLTISATAFGIEVDAPFDIVVARTGRGITYWVFGNCRRRSTKRCATSCSARPWTVSPRT